MKTHRLPAVESLEYGRLLGFRSKPWGREELWALTPTYAAKILSIRPGKKLSLQLHREKRETIYVLEGTLTLWLKAGKMTLRPGQSYHIPPNTVHRFEAKTKEVRLVEVSTPELDDVVRIEDDFGRC